MSDRDYLYERVKGILDILPADDAQLLRDWQDRSFSDGAKQARKVYDWSKNVVLFAVLLGAVIIFGTADGAIFQQEIDQVKAEAARIRVERECLKSLLETRS